MKTIPDLCEHCGRPITWEPVAGEHNPPHGGESVLCVMCVARALVRMTLLQHKVSISYPQSNMHNGHRRRIRLYQKRALFGRPLVEKKLTKTLEVQKNW